MAPDADPYRTLGLERGASIDDVKRAYRRLAKANHPDAAGESALPRFLAIQAAYDQIAGPDARTRRPRATGPGGSGASRRAWEADPDRAGATHRAYGGRQRTRPGPRARPGSPPPGTRASRTPRPDRPPNKATLGSTSYDGAEAEPLDPDWGGASWYGTSSGTYWTLNPKEYADPRKHGPEYQARARRADERRTATSTPPSETLAADAEPPPLDTDAHVAPDRREPPDAPTQTASSWWQPTSTERGAGASADRGADAPVGPPEPPAGRPRSSGPPASSDGPDLSGEAVLDSIRAWLDDRRPGVGARVGRAVAGWAPIALGIGWAAGEVSGCGRFSASCPPAVAPLTWGAQVAVLVLLIVVPRFARVATVATIATLAAVLPASVLLLATSDPASMDAARAVLGGLMTIAWIAGFAFGAAREFRRRPIDRPVS
jgi:curved DNA-binding protein CbpA